MFLVNFMVSILEIPFPTDNQNVRTTALRIELIYLFASVRDKAPLCR